jgi:HAMP domain-containing protein
VSAPRFHRTVRGRITFALCGATLLCIPPVVASVAHIHRLVALEKRLVAACPSGPAPSRTGGVPTVERPPAPDRATVLRYGDEAFRDVLTLASLSFLALVGLAVLLPGQIIRPLRRLIALARQAEGGNLNVARAHVTPDEIGELAGRLNHLFQELRRFDQLKAEKIASLATQRDRLLEFLEDPAVVLDRDGRVLAASPSFSLVFATRISDLRGEVLLEKMGWGGTLETALRMAALEPRVELVADIGEARFKCLVLAPRDLEPSAGFILLILAPLSTGGTPEADED